MTNQKSFLYQLDCKYIKVPVLPELAIRRVWPDAIRIPGVMNYLPDEWHGARRVDRKFFWMILTTLHPEWVKTMIKGSREARRLHAERQTIPRQLLQPAPAWVENLLRDEGFVTARKYPLSYLTFL